MNGSPRVPLPLVWRILAVASLLASCGGAVDAQAGGDAIAQAPDVADGGIVDAPSDDSPEDRADGMSYGDGYGK